MLLVLAAACGDDDVSSDAGIPMDGAIDAVAIDSSLGIECTPDPVRLEETRSCLQDEDCPCGAHCALGLCTTECMSGDECASGRCDAFGRCRSDEDDLPNVSGEAVAALIFEPSALRMNADGAALLFVRATERASSTVRFVADEEIEVSCNGGDFASVCELPSLDPEDPLPRRVDVRINPAIDIPEGTDSAQLRAFSEGGFRSINVALQSSPIVNEPLGEEDCEAGVASGQYEGIAQLVGIGSRGRTAVETPNPGADSLQVALSAQVYEGSGSQRIALTDEVSALFGEDGVVGELVLGAESLLELPTAPLLTAAGSEGRVELGASFESGPLLCGEGRIDTALRTFHVGATPRDDEAMLVWSISLIRVADLEDATAPPVSVAWAPSADFETRANAAFSLEGSAATRLGDLGTSDEERAQAAMCNDGMSARRSFVSNLRDGNTGDLLCSDEAEPFAFPVLRQTVLSVDDVVEACVNDLGDFMDGTESAGDCVDVGRATLGVALGLATDRRRALGTSAAANPLASAIAHRQLQQWLGVSTFVAQSARRVSRLNEIADEAGLVSQSYSNIEALDLALGAASLPLDPRVASGISAMAREVLVAPDYRPRLFADLEATLPDATAAPTHDQNVGLAVSMLDAATQHLALAESLLVAAQERKIDLSDATDAHARVLRHVLPSMAMAHLLRTEANALAEPGWAEEFEHAERRVFAGLLRASEQARRARDGRNPLGIEDGDLPLYRVGDEVGALARFTALSEFLLGTPGSTTEVAPAMVGRAGDALDAARSAWTQTVQRDLDDAFGANGQAAQAATLANEYGGQIISLCGDPSFDTSTVLDLAETIDANRCFVRDECQPTPAERAGSLRAGDLSYGLCMLAQGRRRFGTGFSSLDASIDNLADLMPASPPPLSLLSFEELSDDVAVTASWGGGAGARRILLSKLTSVGELPAGTDPVVLSEIEAGCQELRLRSEAIRPSVAGACVSAQDCPVGSLCDAGSCRPLSASERGPDATCYQGSLGEMALGLISAQQEIEIARSELAEFSEAYDIAMRSCFILREGNDRVQSELESHNNTMTGLGSAKLAMDIAANVAEGIANAGGADDNFFSAGTQAAGSMAAAAFKSASDTLGFAMEEAQRRHDAAVANIEAGTEEDICFNDAELELVGARTVALQVEQVQTEMVRTAVEMRNAQADLRRLLREGPASVDAVASARRPAIAGDFWLDERIDRYESLLRQAKRAVYLSVLASEYEFQFSSDERARTLAANTPTDLEEVLERLRTFSATGTIGGSSPSELVQVVSLRQQLLQLADRSEFAEGFYDLTAEERFRLFVSSPNFAIYDAQGNYLGQEIPFTLTPLERFGLGQSSGIPILSGSDCAERLYSVNASILGEDLHTTDTSFSRITVRKRNTFFSQWCGSEGPDGSAYQVASTRPARNLFLDPLAFADSSIPAVPVANAASVDQTRGFTDARIQARFNLSRGELETEAFSDGDSQELAGRGLYGDYALFLPAETIATGAGDGLRVTQIEDVLLRFDYVSVAR